MELHQREQSVAERRNNTSHPPSTLSHCPIRTVQTNHSLERDLGAPLFIRTTCGLAQSETGEPCSPRPAASWPRQPGS